jgi:hypothetical protein
MDTAPRSVIRWSLPDPATHRLEGLWPKVVLPMIVSPILGFDVIRHWHFCRSGGGVLTEYNTRPTVVP